MLRWVLAMGVLAALGHPAAAQRLAIWNVVQDRCLAGMKAAALPPNCPAVVISGPNDHGYALLKDIRGATQFLLIPTERISGIEDKAVLASDAINYFAEAWHYLGLVSTAAGVRLADDSLSLAINAAAGRTQDQLHIHLDCIRPDVKASLARQVAAIGTSWAKLPEDIDGQHYRAMRIAAPDLASSNPFRLLADGGAGAEMGLHTLFLTSVMLQPDRPVFVLLDGRADAAEGNRGNSELLQDHACTIKAG